MDGSYTDTQIRDIYSSACEKSGVDYVSLVLSDDKMWGIRNERVSLAVLPAAPNKTKKLHAYKGDLCELKPEVIEHAFCYGLNQVKQNVSERIQKVEEAVDDVYQRISTVFGSAACAALVTPVSNLFAITALPIIPVSKKISEAFVSKYMRERVYAMDAGAVADTGNITAGMEYLQSLKRSNIPEVPSGMFDPVPSVEMRIRRLSWQVRSHGTLPTDNKDIDPPAPLD